MPASTTNNVEVTNGFGALAFLLPFFVWMFFFWRGFGMPESSYFDEFLKAAYGHTVEGVQYEPLLDSHNEHR